MKILHCNELFVIKGTKKIIFMSFLAIFSMTFFLNDAVANNFKVTITDNKGETVLVENLQANYSATGNWFPGQRPERNEASIAFKVFLKEGRITTEEYIKIPFDDIKVIEKKGRDKLILEKKDNSKIIYDGNGSAGGKLSIFGHGSLEQKNPNGKVLKSFKNARISAGTIQGEEITLDGFAGKTTTKSGKVGKYSIPIDEIRIIEFQ